MTDLANAITSATNNGNHPGRDLVAQPDGTPDPGPLVITGGVPVTVYVALSGATVTFASSSTGTQYAGGIQWQCNGYALVITFVLAFPITEMRPINPAFWFSDQYKQGNLTCQAGCLASLPGRYDFGAYVPGLSEAGEVIDPIIVVTPIPG